MGFQERLDSFHRALNSRTSLQDVKRRLNRTEWLLVGSYPVALLSVNLAPAKCTLRFLHTLVGERRYDPMMPIKLAPLELVLSKNGDVEVDSRNSMSAVITGPRRATGQFQGGT